MTTAYLDSSGSVAIAFGEPAGRALSNRLDTFDRIVSSNLLEAEFLAALVREKVDPRAFSYLEEISWILPRRSLSSEISRVLKVGYLRGADCWHLAAALYFSPDPGELTFVTLDDRQRSVAKRVGFRI